MFVRNFLDIAQDKKPLDKTFCSTGSSYQRDHAVLVNNDNSQPNVSRSKKTNPFPGKAFSPLNSGAAGPRYSEHDNTGLRLEFI